MYRLTTAEGLKLPESLGGSLYLESLTKVERLKFPKIIGGSLGLPSLTTAEGLKIPRFIGGNLHLNNLTTAEGLKLPIGFDLNKLYCPEHIKEEIMANPSLYYQTEYDNNEIEEKDIVDKNKIK